MIIINIIPVIDMIKEYENLPIKGKFFIDKFSYHSNSRFTLLQTYDILETKVKSESVKKSKLIISR